MNFFKKSDNKNPEFSNPLKAGEPSNMDKVMDLATDLTT